jgi:tetratricopeptide (TPR) repeat protein
MLWPVLSIVLGPAGAMSTWTWTETALAQEREQPAPDEPPGQGAGREADVVTGADPAAPTEAGQPDGEPAPGAAEGEADAVAGEPGAAGAAAGDPEDEIDDEIDGDIDGATAGAESRPWARGVSGERQEKARAVYVEANDLLHEYLLEEAMEKYREALTHWEHPAIHYNLARALDSLGRPLEADAHMQEALRYGAAAYSELEYTQVINFRRLLDQKLATMVIVSSEADIAIALDGKRLLAGRGRIEKRVLPGEHLLVVRRPGQAALTRLLALQRGRQTRIEFDMRRRFPPWQPWGVLGAGALASVTGGLLQWRALENMASYQRRFKQACPEGCPDDAQPALARLRRRATWQNRAGVTALITGGGVLVTGTVLIVLNQSRSFGIDLNRDTRLSVLPLLAPDGAGVALGFEF